MNHLPDHHRILAFHRAIPGYSATPLVSAALVARRLGLPRLWVKDESQRFDLAAYKILGASWAAFRALDRQFGPFPADSGFASLSRLLAPHAPLELVAASEGNHGRAVARAARWLGIDSRIFIPRAAAPWRIDRIRRENAAVVLVDSHYDDAVIAAAAHAGSRGRLFISDTALHPEDDSPRDVVDGYSTLFREIDDQLAALRAPPPALAFVQMGVGALAAAAVHHFQKGSPTRIIGVEPAGADCIRQSLAAGHPVETAGPFDSRMAGLNCGRLSLTAWPLLRDGISDAIAIAPDLAQEAAALLAADGVPATPTGAAGLAGLLQLLPSLTAEDRAAIRERGVLLIATEGVPVE